MAQKINCENSPNTENICNHMHRNSLLFPFCKLRKQFYLLLADFSVNDQKYRNFQKIHNTSSIDRNHRYYISKNSCYFSQQNSSTYHILDSKARKIYQRSLVLEHDFLGKVFLTEVLQVFSIKIPFLPFIFVGLASCDQFSFQQLPIFLLVPQFIHFYLYGAFHFGFLLSYFYIHLLEGIVVHLRKSIILQFLQFILRIRSENIMRQKQFVYIREYELTNVYFDRTEDGIKVIRQFFSGNQSKINIQMVSQIKLIFAVQLLVPQTIPVSNIDSFHQLIKQQMSSPKYTHHNLHSPRNCSKTDDTRTLKKKIQSLKESLRNERREKQDLNQCLNFMREKCAKYELELTKERNKINSLEAEIQRLKESVKSEKQQKKTIDQKEVKLQKKEKVQVGGYFGSLFK